MPRSRYRFGENEYAYFLTCTIVGWLPVFTRPETVQFLYDSWRFLQDLRALADDNGIRFLLGFLRQQRDVIAAQDHGHTARPKGAGDLVRP